MKDLKQQIEELKTRIAQLEGIVSKPEITKDYGKFVPDIVKKYFYLDSEFEIMEDYCNLDFIDENRINYQNTFLTREAAEAEAKYTLISRQYRSFARKLNEGKPFNFNDDKLKWGISYTDFGLSVISWVSLNGSIHQVSFHKKEHAELTLKVFGDDLLILCS
jgi:hypothetical protein